MKNITKTFHIQTHLQKTFFVWDLVFLIQNIRTMFYYKIGEVICRAEHSRHSDSFTYLLKFFICFYMIEINLKVDSMKKCIWVISLSHSKNMLVLVKIAILQSLSFLAEMSSSRSDVVTQSVRVFVFSCVPVFFF